MSSRTKGVEDPLIRASEFFEALGSMARDHHELDERIDEVASVRDRVALAIDNARLRDAAALREQLRALDVRIRALEARTWPARWGRFVDWVMGYAMELGAAEPFGYLADSGVADCPASDDAAPCDNLRAIP